MCPDLSTRQRCIVYRVPRSRAHGKHVLCRVPQKRHTAKVVFHKFNLHELIRFQKLFTKFDQMDIENILPKTLDNSCFMILSEKFFFFAFEI